MKWKEAYKVLMGGTPIKLPEWQGYWRYEEEKNVVIHCSDGKVLNLTDTSDIRYTLEFTTRDDWEIATKENSVILRLGIKESTTQ